MRECGSAGNRPSGITQRLRIFLVFRISAFAHFRISVFSAFSVFRFSRSGFSSNVDDIEHKPARERQGANYGDRQRQLVAPLDVVVDVESTKNRNQHPVLNEYSETAILFGHG